MNTLKSVRSMVTTAAIAAIIVVMASVPFLGYIPLGFMNATIIHVPVIIGAILLGPKYGAFLGLVFGVTSVIRATITPNDTSFVFSPFVSINGFGGNGWSLVIAIVPRVLIGVVAYYVFAAMMKFFRDKKGGHTISLWIAGVAGSLTNTLLVMNLIYIFFGESYAAASNKLAEGFYMVIMSVIVINGVPEAIVAGILVTSIVKVLSKVMN